MDESQPTHEVHLWIDDRMIGPIWVTDASVVWQDDLLAAAAVAWNAAQTAEITVKRISDGTTESFDAAEARDWWA